MRQAREPIALLTCYDFPTAQILEGIGIPLLLVGDSAANTVLGLASTREIPPDFLLTLTVAVRRGAPNVFLLADMPYRAMASIAAAVAMGQRFIGEASADAVKIEIAEGDVGFVAALVAAGIPTCAHLGLLPQRVTSPDGYKAQGRTAEAASTLVQTALACVSAGAQMLLLEAVPDEVTREISSRVDVPVFGCGAGPSADGHVVVLHDMLGFNSKPPRFVEVLGDLPAALRQAATRYLEAITTRAYPAPKHTYKMKSE